MTKKFTRSDSATSEQESTVQPQPNVPISAGALRFTEWEEGARFGGRELNLSRMAGAEQVHVNIMVVPPGKQSCPFHFHMREEEHFYVLDGQCVLRSGNERHVVKPGDYICFPAGQEVGHAFENPYDEDCRILAIGPSNQDEIAIYPDSGKAKLRRTQTIIPWPQESLDYWDGEATSEPVRPT